MAVTGSIEIPIILDDSSLKSSLNSVSNLLDKSFNEIIDKVNGLNKKSVFTLNTKDLDQSISEIKIKIESLNKSKQILLKAEQTPETKKVLTEIEKRLNSLSAEKQIKIDVSKASKTSLNSIGKQIKDLTDKKNNINFDVITKDAEKKLDIVNNELKQLQKKKSKIKLELETKDSEEDIEKLNKEISKLDKKITNAKKRKIKLSTNTKEVSNDIDKIDRELEELEKVRNIKITLDKQRLNTFNNQLNTIGKVGAVALAGLSTALVGASVGIFKLGTSASDAEEITNKLINTFSNLDEAMTNDAVKELTSDYGLARVSAEQLLSTTGDLLVGFGITEDKALSLSLQAQKLAVDLASYQNKDVESVSHALTSAFIGEREALKSLGIAIDEEVIKERLLSEGKNKLTGMALKQAEAEITLAIAMEQSAKAIGDYERTSEGFANQQRLVGENLKNLSVVMGQNFLPALSELAIYTNKAIEEFTEMLETNEELKVSLAEAGQEIADFGKALVDWVLDNLPKMIESLAWIVDNAPALMAAIVAIAGTFITLKLAVLGLTGAFVKLNISTGGIILLVGLLVTGLVALGLAYKDTTSEVEKQQDALEKKNEALRKEHEALEKTLTTQRQVREEASKLVSRYDELSKITKKSVDEQKEQETILKRLKTLYPDLEILYDKNEQAIGHNIDKVNIYIKSLVAKEKQEIEGMIRTNAAYLAISGRQQIQLDKDIEAKEAYIEKLKEQNEQASKSGGGIVGPTGANVAAQQIELAILNLEYQSLTEEATAYSDILDVLGNKYNAINSDTNILIPTTTGGSGETTADETLQEKLLKQEKIYTAQVKINEKLAKNNDDLANRQLKTNKDYWNKRLSLYEQEVEKVASVGGVIEESLIGGMKNAETELNNIDFSVFREELETLHRDYEDDIGITEQIGDEERRKEEQLRIAKRYYDDLLEAEKKYRAEMEVEAGTAGGDVVETSTTETITIAGTDEAIQGYKDLQIEIKEAGKELETLGAEVTDTSTEWEKAMALIKDSTSKGLEYDKEMDKCLDGLESALTMVSDIFGSIMNAVGDMFAGAVDLSNQLIQNKIDNLEKGYEKEQDLLDENYEKELEALDENIEAKRDMTDEELEALDERDEERREIEDELKEHMTEEEYEAVQDRLAMYEGDAEKREELEENLVNAEKQLLLDKEAKEKEYTENKEASDQAYAIKKAELERKQAENSKALNIFDATVGYFMGILDVALATIKMFGLYGPIAAGIMGASLGAMLTATYGMQIGAIAATPLPEIPSFSFGGLVPESNDHMYPNVPKSKYANDKTLAWLSQGEVVLNFDQQEEMRQLMRGWEVIRNTTNNSSDNSIINNNTYTNEIVINATDKMSAKNIAKQVVLQISRGYS